MAHSNPRSDPDLASTRIPDMEMVARAWHALGDEPLDAISFGGDGCNCRNWAPYARRVLELFYGDPVTEPNGLGAVVINPLTGGVWVRAAHPSLPWYDPASASPQHWSDPTCEDWFVWDDLPRPLVVQERGWTPPEPIAVAAPQRQPDEPTGIGAVVADAAGDTWVRVNDDVHPWIRVESGTEPAADSDGFQQVTDWEGLARPIQTRSQGWHPTADQSRAGCQPR